MTTATANPIPSNSPLDLLFNSEKIDEAVNSGNLTYTDRFGVPRKTVAGAMASIAALNTRGAWSSTTAYAQRDVVSNSGTWYIALDNHTSGATFAGDESAHWRVLQGVTADVLADTTSPANGDALIGVKRTLTGAAATTQHAVNEARPVYANIDFGVPSTGLTSATTAIQAMFDACAAAGVREIVFDGTYLLTNPRNDADYTCAVVVAGLKRCKVRGTKGTKFIVGTGGAGSAQFGMFRFEQCEDIEWFDTELDGSGITITGTGANRSRGFVLTNFNVGTAADLAVLNKRIHFHHNYIHDIGGALLVARRSSALAATPVTDGFKFEHNIVINALGQDGGVGLNYVRHFRVVENRFDNGTPATPMFDSMAVDASQGCENGVIEHNYVKGFMFGMKCETATNVGPASNEIRPSKRVLIQNNTLEEIGDPAVLTFGGAATYGIKVHGVNCVARNNSVTHRTTGVTTGGLTSGIVVFNQHNLDSLTTVEANYIKGCQYGVAHTDASSPALRKCTTKIVHNRSDDASLFGIVVTSNVEVDNNILVRSGKAAVDLQSPNLSRVRGNWAYNCGIANSDFTASRVVYQQEDNASVGFFEFSDNHIFDDRGAGAAHYGYFLRGGQVAGNNYIFRPGYTTGLVTGIAFDQYFSTVGFSLQVAGTNVPARREFCSTGIPSSTAPFNTMAWNVGDRAVRTVPSVGSPKAWVCTVAGTPGTWTSEGNL